ncbi:general secretion pathway protein GspG [Desulfonema ishimotonii]|uniref:General secretion pathway protein GspG n=1 Tax=Desulfonema ishimotonii TaxID=45657 RepID=A0A401FS92_9BACT|nr:type II secretion system protein [Desulfonema ishimotonii]GBC59823.1 general secretion pathway protein GspG [Desulfonema ishimotonii]
MRVFFHRQAGLTLIELTVSLAILSILATGIMPLSRMTHQRVRELELRRNLRVIRNALDEYKRLTDEKQIPSEALSSGYPEDLNVLVTGVQMMGQVPVKKKFLRRIPKDPMSEDGEWGLRAYGDEADSRIWGGEDVYDVYSKSDGQALDGSYYRDW